MRLSIEAFGETELSREILRTAHHAEDMSPAFDAVHAKFLELEKEQFESGGKFSGGWKPLSEGYKAAKQRAGLNTNILVATGRLKSSLTQMGAEDSIYRKTPDSAYFGSDVPYGVYHQSRSPRTHLPRRPPVEIPESEKRAWLKILQRYLMTGQL